MKRVPLIPGPATIYSSPSILSRVRLSTESSRERRQARARGWPEHVVIERDDDGGGGGMVGVTLWRTPLIDLLIK